MAERTSASLESVVEELTARLTRLEVRVAELEARPAGAGKKAVAEAFEPAIAGPSVPQGTLALVGRTLLVLAGAYLVRALTDGHVLPAAAGVALGLAYAAALQLLADREALAGRHASAVFHDIASSAIAFPLIWEATARFALPPRAGYAALVAFFALGIGVAWHRRLRANAVVTTLLALATARGAARVHARPHRRDGRARRASRPGSSGWRGAGRGSACAGRRRSSSTPSRACSSRWRRGPSGPRPTRSSRSGWPRRRSSPCRRSTWRASPRARCATARRSPRSRSCRAPLALLLGFGGAMLVLGAHGLPASGPGALSLLLGVLCYGAAFSVAERRPGQGRNFYLYSTAGGLLTLAGTALLATGPALAVTWSLLGLAAAWLGRRFGRMTLRAHAALYLLVAALHTGLAAECARALGGAASLELPPLAWVAAVAALAAWAVLASDPGAPRAGAARAPQLLLAALAVLVVGKAAQAAVWQAAGARLDADPAAAAVVRTAVLAALALGLAVGAARLGLAELRWLVYPVVVLGGLKLLTQDLRLGRPATLVVSLALYGLVLVLLPRLTKVREPWRADERRPDGTPDAEWSSGPLEGLRVN